MTQRGEENLQHENKQVEPEMKLRENEESDDIDGERMDEEDDEVDEDEQAIQDEYRLWKKNTPFLYDTVLTHCLTWPSLTCEWLPDKSEPSGSDYSVQKLILGTQTADGNENHLLIASVRLPRDDMEVDVAKFDESAQESSGAADQYRIAVHTRICHPGEVNRARHNPRNPFMIATKTVSGEVLLFDYSKHPSRPNSEGVINAQATLKGHTAEGYALDWSNVKENFLASGADDNLVCVWDTQASSWDQPLVLRGHSKPVECVAWNNFNADSLISVGDDRKILLWDIRSSSAAPVIEKINGHQGDINAVSWSSHTEFLFATSGADKVVNLWDSRRCDKAIYALEGAHTGEITNVVWAPFSEHLLASSGLDRRVVVWDLSRIGDELNSEESADGPPELLFKHSGHTGRVNDFGWNPNEEWTIASVADDNILQVWRVAENVWNTDSDDEPDQ